MLKKIKRIIGFFVIIYLIIATIQYNEIQTQYKMKKATFGGGCFWCTEAIFNELEGVMSVEAGYAGGHVNNPSYDAVCTGTTGYAEVIQIQYNSDLIDYELLLDVFFHTHNPTTLNRQGADVGTQYRSVIFYHDEKQRSIAENMVEELSTQNIFDDPIVTEISPINNYYKAENYHQNYYANNPSNGYCNVVINPKLTKFMKKYKAHLKKEIDK